MPVGRIVYTQWLNEQGGIEADLTVTREAEDRYLVVTAAATQVRDLAWLRDHIPSDARCMVDDVTSRMAVLSVMGPESRELLQPLTLADLDNDAFPFGTSREIDLGYAQVRASRITYVGELGLGAVRPHRVRHRRVRRLCRSGRRASVCGSAATTPCNSLRMEKGYRHWGHDISPDDTPLEAGLGFAVAWDKPAGFVGRDALTAQREAGVRTPLGAAADAARRRAALSQRADLAGRRTRRPHDIRDVRAHPGGAARPGVRRVARRCGDARVDRVGGVR